MKLEPVYLLEPEPEPERGMHVSRRMFALGAVGLFLGGLGAGGLVFGGSGEAPTPSEQEKPQSHGKFSREWARETAAASDATLFEHAPAMILAASRWQDDEVLQGAIERLVSITLAMQPSQRRQDVAMSLVAWFNRHPAREPSIQIQIEQLRRLNR